ncbi:hypothetical protein RDI58_006326 [Solanum bulbocastanum]|uniref:Uncharacterized protein n=1 Tax=Solanum bulbocastanum TaxID=147425 RepID=A0AAN8UAJ4_SOLBU
MRFDLLMMIRLMMLLGLIKCAASGLDKVGGKHGWDQNVNYTDWASHQHFSLAIGFILCLTSTITTCWR